MTVMYTFNHFQKYFLFGNWSHVYLFHKADEIKKETSLERGLRTLEGSFNEPEGKKTIKCDKCLKLKFTTFYIMNPVS